MSTRRVFRAYARGNAPVGRVGSCRGLPRSTIMSMPQEAPDSLGAETYVDVVSYLLKANGSPAGAADLPSDRMALKQILVTVKEVR